MQILVGWASWSVYIRYCRYLQRKEKYSKLYLWVFEILQGQEIHKLINLKQKIIYFQIVISIKIFYIMQQFFADWQSPRIIIFNIMVNGHWSFNKPSNLGQLKLKNVEHVLMIDTIYSKLTRRWVYQQISISKKVSLKVTELKNCASQCQHLFGTLFASIYCSGAYNALNFVLFGEHLHSTWCQFIMQT